jgi:hypothetical protein
MNNYNHTYAKTISIKVMNVSLEANSRCCSQNSFLLSPEDHCHVHNKNSITIALHHLVVSMSDPVLKIAFGVAHLIFCDPSLFRSVDSY